MPKREEPSLRLKNIIWDIAATRGTDNIPAISRDLDYELERLRKDEESDFFEDTPSERKIKQIIEEEINVMPPEAVISKLPRHIWHLRKDYDDILKSIEQSSTKELDSREHQVLAVERASPFHFIIEGIYNHDRDIFNKSNDILNEERLISILYRLEEQHIIHHKELINLHQNIEFFSYESNKYIESKLKDFCNNVCEIIRNLVDFIDISFDILSEHTMRMTGARWMDIEDLDEKEEVRLDRKDRILQLKSYTDKCREAYSTYRSYIRENLFL